MDILLCNVHTPNFQPRIGMSPVTDTVMPAMVSVARLPTMMFIVAITRMGKAKAIPTAIPVTAEETSV